MRARLALIAGLLIVVGGAAAQDFSVEGSCRDGLPHGSYELRDDKGTVRVVGAFNRGKRTGSFLFWASTGVRTAHLPFDDDALSGTVAVWYADPRSPDERRRKLEAVYSRGRLNGSKRSWFPNGRLRSEYGYERGVLRSATATSESGKALPESEARELAARDLADDEALYASLLAIVNSHLPRCEPATDRLEKA